MSIKTAISETPASGLVMVRATCTINDGQASRKPGSVFEVTQKDADLLIKAGAVILATDTATVPIEEILPIGMDPRVWMADPRLKVNGSPPSSFVKREEYAAYFEANR